MKLEQLRQIIREEVRAAVKEELQDMLNEAVRVASQPQVKHVTQYESYKPVEVKNPKPTFTDPIMEMLNQTKASMTESEYKNIYTGTSDIVQKPNFASMMASNMGMIESKGAQPGLDISQFDFVKKAALVYNKSVQKDKEKYGIS
jgi:hypothetical protein